MAIVYVVLGIVAGMLVPLEAGMNGRLGRALGNPLHAALVACSGGVVVLGLLCVLTTRTWPGTGRLMGAPWWAYAGGALGAMFVAAGAVAAPRVGALALIASIIAGQMLCSLVVDHFGLIGFPIKPVTAWRIAGVLLIAAGVALVVGRTA